MQGKFEPERYVLRRNLGQLCLCRMRANTWQAAVVTPAGGMRRCIMAAAGTTSHGMPLAIALVAGRAKAVRSGARRQFTAFKNGTISNPPIAISEPVKYRGNSSPRQISPSSFTSALVVFSLVTSANAMPAL